MAGAENCQEPELKPTEINRKIVSFKKEDFEEIKLENEKKFGYFRFIFEPKLRA